MTLRNEDHENDEMLCEWCCLFDRNKHRNQFVKACAWMKLESIKKHEKSRQLKDSEAAQCTHAKARLHPRGTCVAGDGVG